MKIWPRLDMMLPEGLTQRESEDLARLLGSSAFLKAARLIKEEMDGKRRALQMTDFSQMQGIHQAVKLQGELVGLERFLDALAELCPEEKQDAA